MRNSSSDVVSDTPHCKQQYLLKSLVCWFLVSFTYENIASFLGLRTITFLYGSISQGSKYRYGEFFLPHSSFDCLTDFHVSQWGRNKRDIAAFRKKFGIRAMVSSVRTLEMEF